MAFISSPKTRVSGILFAGLVLLSSLGTLPGAFGATTALDGFNPNANGTVNTVLIQPDGKILMGGYFTQLHPYGGAATASNFIARLNHDGTVDTTFGANANGVVRAMALQADGKILVAGNFSAFQGTGSNTLVGRSYIARLNTDGSVDTSYNPNVNGVVYAVAVDAAGRAVIGGTFTAVQANGAAAATTRNHIARINVDGTVDTSFDPNADKTVLALAVQPNGQIVVGGGFSKFQPNGASTTTSRNCAARLNSDGSIDTGFDPEPNGSVMAILVLPSGQIVLGGQF